MPYTIYIEETNAGYVTFNTEQEAEEWLEEPDFSDIKWTGSFDLKTEIVKED